MDSATATMGFKLALQPLREYPASGFSVTASLALPVSFQVSSTSLSSLY
jgi:hypothetical protein